MSRSLRTAVLSTIALVLVVGVVPALASTPSCAAGRPGEMTKRQPAVGELAARRTQMSTTRRNADGTESTTVSAGSVNYRTPAGFEPIDSTLEKDTTAGMRWRNRANRFAARFADRAGASYMRLSAGTSSSI